MFRCFFVLMLVGACEVAPPSWEDSNFVASEKVFDCPAHKMKYDRLPLRQCKSCGHDEAGNPTHFDCDDFSLACAIWGKANGFEVWQLSVSGKMNGKRHERTCKQCGQKYSIGGALHGAHVVNVVLFDEEYCVIEPQRGSDNPSTETVETDHNQVCCWDLVDGSDVPQECLDATCKIVGIEPGCKGRRMWADATHSRTAGESSFWARPLMCDGLAECGVSLPKPKNKCVVKMNPPTGSCQWCRDDANKPWSVRANGCACAAAPPWQTSSNTVGVGPVSCD